MAIAFEVLHPGILTNFQDLGRRGFRKYGIPQSGALDAVSLRIANLLVGNNEGDVGLEVTLQGLRIVTLSSVSIAVAGADLSFTINSEYAAPWRSFNLSRGDEIRFVRRVSGLRSYIAVSGGFASSAFLGSCSVFARGKMGRPLVKGDTLLTAREGASSRLQEVSIPDYLVPRHLAQTAARIVLGPQEDAFTSDGITTFLSATYRIRPESDRMAYRLSGPAVGHRAAADIISEPVVPGSIQVPRDGMPILLLQDAQVSGGYAKIGTVVRADLPGVAQRMPGEEMRFETVDLETAAALWLRQERLVEEVRNFFAGIAVARGYRQNLREFS